jgi:uncharacterized protein YbjT (DUF2867 family)
MILLTGATGTAGSFIANEFVRERVPVRILVRNRAKTAEERLKGGIESQVDLSTHRLFNVKPTTFLEFAQRNAEGFGAAAAAA